MPSPRSAAAAAGILSAAALTASATMTAEGWQTTPYKDTTGKWTVCGGETHDVDPHRIYTQQDCLKMFVVSLVSHGADIDACLPSNVPDETHAAYLDMAYNIGSTKFCASSVAKKAQSGDFKGSCEAILLYKFAGGKDCSLASSNCYGIWIRRQAEYHRCIKGIIK